MLEEEKQEEDYVVIKAKTGPKTKYRPWMCDAVVEVAKEGGFHAAMMVRLDVCTDTFYTWKREIPEFKEAVAKADLISLAIQEDLLIRGARGEIKNYNFASNAFTLNNKYRSLYPRHNSPEGDTNITVNNLNLSKEQLDYKISQLTQKLKARGLELSNSPEEKKDE